MWGYRWFFFLREFYYLNTINTSFFYKRGIKKVRHLQSKLRPAGEGTRSGSEVHGSHPHTVPTRALPLPVSFCWRRLPARPHLETFRSKFLSENGQLAQSRFHKCSNRTFTTKDFKNVTFLWLRFHTQHFPCCPSLSEESASLAWFQGNCGSQLGGSLLNTHSASFYSEVRLPKDGAGG